MQTLDIFRAGQLFVTVKPDPESNQSKAIMGANTVRIVFTDSRYINFQINDYCTVFGEKYVLAQPPVPTKESQFKFRYTLELVSEGTLLARVQYHFLGDDNSLKEPYFSLMGNTRTFMNLLLQNLQRIDNSWSIGEVVPSGYKNMTFQAENCYNALSRISEEFETEFWLEGKKIHLTKRSYDTGNVVKHGRNKGLYEITSHPVDNSSVVTRLYAFGSEQNIPSDYRNFSKRLRMTDGQLYVENNVSRFGVIEFTKIFEDIYPHRTGKVTSVDATDPFKFRDISIDFDINAQLLPGISAKVSFNTGQLSGYTLEIKSFNNSTKEVVVLLNKDERALDIPNANIRPAIGDEYVLVDIIMPDTYITAAEAELKAAAESLLTQISEPQLKYTVVFDPTYLRRKSLVPKIGDLIWIIDEQLELQRKIRITSTTRNLLNEYEITVEIADVVTRGKIDVIVNTQNSNAREIIDIDRYLQNNSTLNNNIVGDMRVRQGTIVFEDLPTTSTTTGFSDILIENTTGKLYRKV